MKGFITEDNNHLAQTGGVMYCGGRRGKSFEARRFVSHEWLDALSRGGLNRVCLAVREAVGRKK
jgi:hypothetical protein